jgi:hypothetical protein
VFHLLELHVRGGPLPGVFLVEDGLEDDADKDLGASEVAARLVLEESEDDSASLGKWEGQPSLAAALLLGPEGQDIPVEGLEEDVEEAGAVLAGVFGQVEGEAGELVDQVTGHLHGGPQSLLVLAAGHRL